MQKWTAYLFLFVALIASSLTALASPPPVVYLQSDQVINLRSQIRQWIPSAPTNNPEIAFKALNDGKFVNSNDLRITPNHQAWYALRYDVNPSFSDSDVLLRLVVGSEFSADIFYLQNSRWEISRIPDFLSPSFLQLKGGGYGIRLPASKNDEQWVLIRPSVDVPVNMRLQLTTERHYYRNLVTQQMPLMLSLGAISALMLVIIFWKWRNAKVRSLFLLFAALNIFSGLFFYGYLPKLNQHYWFQMGQIFTVVYLSQQLLLLLIVAKLVNLDKASPKLFFCCRALVVGFSVVIVTSIFASIWSVFIVFLTLVLLALLLEFILAIRAILLNSVVGIYVALATIATFGLTSLQAWRNIDLLQSESLYLASSQAITVCLLFSLTLAVLRYGKKATLQLHEPDEMAAKRAADAWVSDITTLSQEIRTPATGVIGMAQLLQRSELTASQRHYANIIASSANEIVDTLGSVLDITKVSTGNFNLIAVPFSMEQLFIFLADFFEFESSNVDDRFQGQFLEKMPSFFLGDQVRLQEIIAISMRTLLRFSQERLHFDVSSEGNNSAGEITLKFFVEAKDVRLSPEAKQRFMEICNDHSSQMMLLGGARGSAELGLVLVKKLVKEFGGEMGVDYSSNRSMSIWFTVQLAIDTNKQLKFDKDQAQLRNKHVAIVFTSKMFAESVASHFKAWDMQVDIVDDSSGWLSFAMQDYDLVLLSNGCQWPVIDVLERAREIDVPILLADAYGKNQVTLTDIPRMRMAYFAIGATLPDMCAAMVDLLSHRDVSYFNKITQVAGKFHQFNVLLAEDNPVNQQVIMAMLRNLGVEADVVSDGSEVLTRIFDRPEHYDLILMDYDMPQMNGVEAARALRMRRRNSVFKPLTICGLTAHATSEVRESCIAAGMDAVLVKPINLSVLEDYLRSVFIRLDKDDESGG